MATFYGQPESQRLLCEKMFDEMEG